MSEKNTVVNDEQSTVLIPKIRYWRKAKGKDEIARNDTAPSTQNGGQALRSLEREERRAEGIRRNA